MYCSCLASADMLPLADRRSESSATIEMWRSSPRTGMLATHSRLHHVARQPLLVFASAPSLLMHAARRAGRRRRCPLMLDTPVASAR